MQKNILYLLIFSCVLCQGILGSVADKDIKKPSDVLVRHKRVYHTNTSINLIARMEHTPYVVNIKIKNGDLESNYCVGVILTAHTIITAPRCARLGIEQYSVYSGSILSTGGLRHSVIGQRIHINEIVQDVPYRVEDGVALMFVNPPFPFGFGTGPIAIHRAPIPRSSFGTISGWGYDCPRSQEPEPVVLLKTISVRILNNVNCEVLWRTMMRISPNDICTHDVEQHCGHTDAGAPLVVNNQLVGIHLFRGGFRGGVEIKPDIFARVQHPEYFNWIVANIR